MRCMMFMIPKVYQGAKGRKVGEGFSPDADIVEKMTRYNEELAKAGVLVSLDGLRPPAKGVRINFSKGRGRVSGRGLPESKNVVGGYWILDVASVDEAVEWAKHCPALEGDVIEVRPIFGIEDFPPDVRKAAESSIVEERISKH